MEIVRLKGCEYEESTDFLDLVFSSAYSPIRFREILPVLYRPDDKHMGCNYAVRENGKIRAIVGLFPAEIKAGDETLKLGGIGGVSSHNNDRGKGWMKALMNTAIEEMRRNGTDISFLTGRRQRYEYFGYTKAGIMLRYFINKDNLRHHFKEIPNTQKLSYVQVSENDRSLLSAMKALHDGQPFYCERAQEDFYLYLISMRSKPWAALYPDGRTAGYFVTDEHGGRINEIFAENDTVFEEMTAGWFSSRETDTLEICLAPWQESFAKLLGAFAEDHYITNNENWRVFNWDRVVRVLLKIKNDLHPLPDGHMLIGVKDWGVMDIRVSGGSITCEKTGAAAELELDSLTAMRVLAGNVPADYTLSVPDNKRELMNSWFPLPLSWLIQNYV